MANGISLPTIIVNNENITISAGSSNFKRGKGDRTFRVGSVGGGATESVFTENGDTKKGMIKFSVFPTKAMIDKIESWQDEDNNNTVQIIDNNNNFDKTCQHAGILEDPDVALGADTLIEIIFEGDPLV